MRYGIKAIGKVSNEIKHAGRIHCEDTVSRLVLEREYTQALDGIGQFSHIIVIYWLHKISKAERLVLKTHPRRDPSLPLTGIFATRSPARPNPIGISTVKLLGVEDNVLRVMGLDAIDGTPVLDIKPYMPEPFSPADVKVPRWISATAKPHLTGQAD